MSIGSGLILLLFVSFSLVYILKTIAKRSLTAGRTPLPLDKIHASVNDRISLETFEETWQVAGKAFSIDPELIRPSDTLEMFGKIDSWTLGHGEEKLNKWLDRKGAKITADVHTLVDLACCVE